MDPSKLQGMALDTFGKLTGSNVDLAGNDIIEDLQWLFQHNHPFLLLFAPLGVFFAYFILRFIRNRFANFFQKRQRLSALPYMFFAQIRTFFILALAIYLMAHFIELSALSAKVIRIYVTVCMWLQLTIFIYHALKSFMEKLIDKKAQENPTVESARPLCLTLVKLVVWTFGALLVLDTLGFDVTAILAGLGIGGMAMALAAQKILADLFASISIIVDNPFRVGEKIEAGDVKGRVEYIGMKTTQIRAETGELVFCPNGTLTNAKLKNLDRRK